MTIAKIITVIPLLFSREWFFVFIDFHSDFFSQLFSNKIVFEFSKDVVKTSETLKNHKKLLNFPHGLIHFHATEIVQNCNFVKTLFPYIRIFFAYEFIDQKFNKWLSSSQNV